MVVVALIAAGAADLIVESISNCGIFGAQYSDNDHLGVLPTVFAGLAVALEMLALRFVDIWRRSSMSPRSTLLDVARNIGTRSFASEFPVIFGLQLVALFALESSEQIASGGRLLGGTAWLGGPVVFSLLVHAVIGGLSTLALGASMRAVVRAFASLVQSAARFIWLFAQRAGSGAFRVARRAVLCARTQAPHVRQIGGRAPPLLQTPA